MKTDIKKQEGFTIIEVLIVLAIAATILLLVFLAVPALNRRSANTKRANDVAAIGSAMQDYTSNHNGSLPADQASFNSDVLPNAKLSFYDSSVVGNVKYVKNTTAQAPTGPGVGQLDKVEIDTYTHCTDDNSAAQSSGATSRNAVALYRIETGGNNNGILVCKDLL